MTLACLLILGFLLQISCSTRSGFVRRCSPRTISSSSPNSFDSPQDVDSYDFKTICLELNREIKTFAMNQLGRTDPISNFNYTEYEIKNWPEFVPYLSKNWDKQAVEDLRRVLPTLVFKPKDKPTHRTSSDFSMEYRTINRRKLLDKIIELFNNQTESTVGRIPWCQYHLYDWPVGVNLRADHWTVDEVLAIYRHLDRIKFVRIEDDQPRTVTFTDGTSIKVDSKGNEIGSQSQPRRIFPRRKRTSRKYDSDDEFDYEQSETSSENEQHESSDSESENQNQNDSSSSSLATPTENNQNTSDINENIGTSTAVAFNIYDDKELDFGLDINEDEPATPHESVFSGAEDGAEDGEELQNELRTYDPNSDSFYDEELEFDEFLAMFIK